MVMMCCKMVMMLLDQSVVVVVVKKIWSEEEREGLIKPTLDSGCLNSCLNAGEVETGL
jgi:hypothetical protein